MKKYLSILCLFLCAVVVLSFSSCTKEPADTPDDGNVEETKNEETKAEETKAEEKPVEPATAGELWKLIDEKMTAAKSYEADLALDMTMFVGGFKFESKTTGYEILSEADDYYYYCFTNTKMVCEELSLEETEKQIEAYNGGMAFMSNVSGEKAQNLCSKMTAEEYKEFTKSALSEDFDYEDCTKAEFVKNDDGTWNLSFSGYTKKAISTFLGDMGIDDGDMGADIIDMKISLTAAADYYVKEMSLEFVFDVEETDTAIPVLKETAKYSKYNEAQRTTTGIEPDGYTEVADIRVLDDVTDGISEFCDQAEGAFVLDTKQVLKDSRDTATITEKDTISFGKKNGSYIYFVDIVYNGQPMSVSYKSGVQTVTVNGETQNVPQSEDEAKAYIDGLVNSALYSAELVTNIEKMSDGVYKLYVTEPEADSYKTFLSNYGIEFKSATQEIIVTFTDGKIAKIESEVKCLGEYTENGKTEGIDFNVMTIVTVQKVTAPGQNA